MNLIAEVKNGNERAFELLVQQWYAKIYKFAYRYFNEAHQAEEVTQNVFIQVFEKINQLKNEQRFPSWIYTIANNSCNDHGRKSGRLIRLKDRVRTNTVIEFARSPEVIYQQKEKIGIVQKLLQQIPENQRTVIIMKEYEGLTFKEIAEITNESENTIKSRMYYGLNAMRKICEEQNLLNK